MGIKLTLEKYATLNTRAKTFLDEEKEASKVKRKRFDFVVGNPPYIRTHRIGEKEVYEKTYPNLVIGQYDISYLFVGRGIEWLNPAGKLGYITSNKFSVLESGIGLRKYILNTCQFKQFIDFSGVQTFPSSLPSAAIMIMEKVDRPSKDPIQTDIKTQKEIPLELQQGDLRLQEEALDHLLKNLNFYTVSQGRFYKNAEFFFDLSLPDKLVSLVKNIGEKSKKLIPTIVSDVKRGLRPDTSKFKDEFFISSEELNQIPTKERDIYKMHIRGKNIVQKHRIKWDGEYVKFFPDKMAEGGHKELYECPKITIKRIGEFLRSVYDEKNYYCYKTIHIIRDIDSQVDLKYLTGVLNSRLIDFYYKTRFYLSRLGRGNFSFREAFLKHLPIIQPHTEKQTVIADKIKSKVTKINQRFKELDKLENKIDIFPEKYLGDVRKFDKVTGAAEDIRELKKESYKISNPRIEPFKDLSGQTKYKLTLAKGNNIVFSTREQAEYILNWLKSRDKVSRKEILELEVPAGDYLQKVIKEFEGDKKKVDEIKREVKRLEDEIDELVFDLYGLGKEEKEVINSFLERIKA